MDVQRQDNQLEPTYSSTVSIQGVSLKIYRKQWTIEKGSEKGSGVSVLMAWHDDDDDDDDDDEKNDRCLTELLVTHSNTWNHLIL